MCCVLKFTVKENDPSTGEAEEEGYEEYQLRTLWWEVRLNIAKCACSGGRK
jgi:hypothetical protein